MKRVCKGSPPETLIEFIMGYPDATWEQMCDENTHAANDCRVNAVHDQCGLCAYCERKISSDDPLHRRIEHFHPKSDKAGSHNWGLDWVNMLAVCDGGSRRSPKEGTYYPLPGNLSCDEHKNHMINKKKLHSDCEGYVLNPLDVPPFPNLFTLDMSTGYLKPDEDACAAVEVRENAYNTTAELVSNTIDILNLNCDRLAEKRRRLIWNINRNIKTLRDYKVPPSEMHGKLVDRYFKSKWPEFFTTIRCCLGSAAEEFLLYTNYVG